MSCLIGIADSIVASEQEITWDTNKIGGQVVLPPEVKTKFEPTCVLCGRQLLLVVQLYCPLQYSPYHRVMYVFACGSPQCWNKSDSWIVYRYQILDSSSANTKNTPNRLTGEDSKSGTDDWGVGDTGDSWGAEGADDWGDEANNWGMEGTDDWGTEEKEECREKGIVKDPISGIELSKGIEDKCDGNIQDNYVDHKDSGTCQKSDSPDASYMDYKQAISVDMGIQQMNIHDPDSDSNNDSHVIPEDSCNVEIDKTVLKEMCEVSDTLGSRSTIMSYYLNVFEEPASQEEDSNHVIKLLKEYEKKEGYRVCDTESMAGSSGRGSEGYEKTNVRHKDLTFHKFHKRVSFCPQQCIRYEWSGTPLYVKELPVAECPTRCCHCDGETVFEFQLMPALVNYLKAAETTDVTVEFGTVLVFTCKQSCWEEGDVVKKEQVIVQPDPDQHFFR